LDFEGRSLKAQMRAANRADAEYVVVIGPEERSSKKFKLKEMATGKEEVVLESSLFSSRDS
jgi:histidyl-tRNA synthetase